MSRRRSGRSRRQQRRRWLIHAHRAAPPLLTGLPGGGALTGVASPRYIPFTAVAPPARLRCHGQLSVRLRHDQPDPQFALIVWPGENWPADPRGACAWCHRNGDGDGWRAQQRRAQGGSCGHISRPAQTSFFHTREAAHAAAAAAGAVQNIMELRIGDDGQTGRLWWFRDQETPTYSVVAVGRRPWDLHRMMQPPTDEEILKKRAAADRCRKAAAASHAARKARSSEYEPTVFD